MKNKSDKGFTLIELMVVVAILGIMTVIAMPRLGRLQRNMALAAEGRTLYAGFLEAQGMAASRGATATLTIDQPSRSWQIQVSGSVSMSRTLSGSYVEFGPESGISNDFDAPYNNIPRDDWCACNDASSDSDCNDICKDDEANIEFDSNNKIAGGANGAIMLRNSYDSGSPVYVVVFMGLTGNVRLFKMSE